MLAPVEFAGLSGLFPELSMVSVPKSHGWWLPRLFWVHRRVVAGLGVGVACAAWHQGRSQGPAQRWPRSKQINDTIDFGPDRC